MKRLPPSGCRNAEIYDVRRDHRLSRGQIGIARREQGRCRRDPFAPIIAVLLDLKLMEFGIHANVIDHFVMRNFPEPPVISEGEHTKWGLGSHLADSFWMQFRSVVTVGGTVVPTSIIAILSVLAARAFLAHEPFARHLLCAAICFCPIYLVAGLISIRTLFFRR